MREAWPAQRTPSLLVLVCLAFDFAFWIPYAFEFAVEMFKVRVQGQYGGETDKRLRAVAREMWTQWGFRKGVMRGYWVRRTRYWLATFLLAYLFVTR